MGADYIPEKDFDADTFMRNFAARLVEEPQTYRTTPGDAAEVFEACQAFHVAYSATCTPGIQSSPLIRTKNEARKSAERLVRPAYQRIRTDGRIDVDAKVRIGVQLTQKRRRHVGPPQGSTPFLHLERDMGGRVTIRATDTASGRKARPKEAGGFELFERIRSQALIREMRTAGVNEDSPDALAQAAVAVSVGRVIGAWRYVGTFTATPIILAPAIEESGDELTYVARWVSRRGEPGVFGQPVRIWPAFNPGRDIAKMPRVQRRQAA